MAHARQLDGDMERALVLYRKSINLHPTAEAHTYLAWAEFAGGNVADAIEHCRAAIRLEPEFANAWNDIGAYLVTNGRPDEALFFLKRATRLEPAWSRCFPHYNLHCACLAIGDRSGAIEHLQSALNADPQFGPALDALNGLMRPDLEEDEDDDGLGDALLIGTPVLAVPPAAGSC